MLKNGNPKVLKTIKFNKTECGVDFLLNVLIADEIRSNYFDTTIYNTDFFEILFFKKAKGHLILNHEKIALTDNSIFFISPFQKRKWQVDIDTLDFTLLVFQEDFLNDFFSDKLFTYRLLYFYQLEHTLKINVTHKEIEKACEMLKEIKTELVAPKSDSVHIIRSLLYYLLQKLNREYAQKHMLSLDRQENNYAYQLKNLLEKHIKDKQRIEEYTSLLGVSRITLNKAVKDQFNVTATHLLKQRLLFEIKNMLIHTNMTIADIAFELHYSEPNHLMRFFKTQTGLTTTDFLTAYQNGIFS